MPLNEALRRAQLAGVDLVEIAPNAQPPVCRMMDLGKFRYEQARKEREARKHQHATKVKELKFHANISEHDYGVKVRHIRGFLEENVRVKISLMFRGREMAHMEIGKNLMKRVVTDCADVGHPEMEPKLIGRSIHMMLTPKPASKRAKAQASQAAAAESVAPAATPSAAPEPSGGFANTPKIVVTGKQPS